jgi:hypothetical protein
MNISLDMLVGAGAAPAAGLVGFWLFVLATRARRSAG